MLINKTNVGAIFVNLRTEFNKGFAGVDPTWQKIAMRVPSNAAQEFYAWLSNFPKMRRWIGEKNIRALAAYDYAIKNADFEATVEVDRNDIEDDRLGIYAPQAKMAGWSAAQWPDELVAEVVNGAFTKTCWDGQYFCDTDHVVAGASVSNKGTAALSVSTQAAAISSYGAARTAMMSFKDDEGRPLGVNPDTLLVGPALMDTATVLLTNDRLEDGKPNPYKGTANLVVFPHVTSTTAWFVLDTKMPVKPFVFQERKKPVFVEQTDMENDDVFMRRKFKFGAEARGEAGYGYWQLCYGSTGAG